MRIVRSGKSWATSSGGMGAPTLRVRLGGEGWGGRWPLDPTHHDLQCEPLDVPARVPRPPRVDPPERDETTTVLPREVRDEAVHVLLEAHDLRGPGVDGGRPLDARVVA